MNAGLSFWKLDGAGNDFVLVDGRSGAPPMEPPLLARALCDRRRGVGADGLLVVLDVRGNRVRVGYWNADGSPAAFCGNGARCVALLAAREGWAGKSQEISFPGVVACADVAADEGRVRLAVPAPKLTAELVVQLGDRRFPASTWTMGVVHVIVAVPEPELKRLALEEVSRAAEAATGLEDPNVTLVAGEGKRLYVRTRERGAGETLACGSAALAAAAWWGERGGAVEVVPPGGVPLVVRAHGGGDALLEGPARIVFRGTWIPFPA